MRVVIRSFIHAIVLSMLAAGIASADVYRWKDERGKTHYGERPVEGAQILPMPSTPQQEARWFKVAQIQDGDTITLANGEKIRLLGINAPETGGRRGQEAGGIEARDWLRNKVQGQKVRLEADAEIRDHYGRLLAHVFSQNEKHINLELVEQGLATLDIYPPNLKYADELVAAERKAEEQKRGLWGMAEYQPKLMDSLGNDTPQGWQRLVGKPNILADGKGWRGLGFAGGFEVRIPMKFLEYFPPLESYLGQTLEARGWIIRHDGGRHILVRYPSALLRL